mmetsp:Transcript_30200/g.55181  ORF Transcript_30200/g.55181 Transcript_30200/m.55181 type:complete len:159 (-) Transcript_30200:236-712(-)|eukprot:CAMPEP_0175054820 /NCGR_PEP_ID=MMETSP0052_2-20121109/9717_1 /TAXON_ID=51329 ORGANISM="Polytomella parva, Strain SAG 63-3" /NCGR_SAMPLE_ID=MMETSP0052_2 /ASSEMBLY_ACC=CAM_ASM_000194 /LENGTH=158 /DNA_ID=CAMNT_0016319557 /DNA_START=81 /DNA_END=557 /DNA_ORIENTATION=+
MTSTAERSGGSVAALFGSGNSVTNNSSGRDNFGSGSRSTITSVTGNLSNGGRDGLAGEREVISGAGSRKREASNNSGLRSAMANSTASTSNANNNSTNVNNSGIGNNGSTSNMVVAALSSGSIDARPRRSSLPGGMPPPYRTTGSGLSGGLSPLPEGP